MSENADTPTQGEPVQDSTPVEQPTNTEPTTAEGPASLEINGENVSLEELKAGYLRQSDYTKKTQRLAEEQKKYEALLDKFKGQTSDTVSAPAPTPETPTTSDIPINEDIIRRFMAREQKESVKERMAEWDSFKTESGLELTPEEEASFMTSLAEREAAGKSVNISEMASLRFLSKIAEAKAKKMLVEELARAKDKSRTVGPGEGGKPSAPKADTTQALIDLAKQHGLE